MSRSAIVVGGGWAGLAAALGLADRGVRVRLFERRAILGGRAYSYRAREAGHAVDNGQHLLMGCYTETLRLLERVGAADRAEIQPQLSVPFLHPDRGTSLFSCARLPSPLHLTVGAMRYTHLTPAERLRLVVGGLSLTLRYRHSDATVAEALAAVGQNENLRVSFWNPLSIAVLNELPERASASLFAEVLRRVFFAQANASKLVFPRFGLSDVFPEPAARAIEAAGGTVERGRTVRGLIVRDGRAAGVRLHDGAEVEADAVVLAVTPAALLALLPEEARAPLAGVAEIRPAPIVSVHFWFEGSLPTPRMAGFLVGPVHWLFTPPMQPERGSYVTLVTSGAHDLVERDPAEIAEIARRELDRYVPAARGAALADSLVVKEPAATYAATPAEQARRPAPVGPVPGLFLAGDWTDTKLPATLESAVVSGAVAADAAGRRLVG